MGKIVIHGGNALQGSVDVQGSKNATLPVMAASILNAGVTVILKCPDIADVDSMKSILEYLGCVVNREEDTLIIDSAKAVSRPITPDMTNKLRASSILIGPLLARFGSVYLADPGGCQIGRRPIDIHLEAVKRLGASWEHDANGVAIRARKLLGSHIHLRFPSVGATENAVMAAVGATGSTRIQNAAKEPEVISLCEYLKKIGVAIEGEGTDTITIAGGCELTDGVYETKPDRIVMGTYMAAAAACGGELFLGGCQMYDARGFLDIYTGMGMQCRESGGGLWLQNSGRCRNVNYIETGPYPEFPTDMQSVTMSVAAVSEGTVCICEKVFEDRFKTVRWLREMGADIVTSETKAWVKGVDKLKGATVYGEDLRGTAALVVAGLAAEGTTVIENADYIMRGYVNLCEEFRKLGADIVWECS